MNPESPTRMRLNFLHIGKNAGTEIRRYIDRINAAQVAVEIVKHTHDTFMIGLPRKEAYFFSIRNPVTRFRSAFYSRKRMGQPRYYNKWTPHEAAAFGYFEHANQLAEALFDENEVGRRAFAAMKSIRHTAQNQSDWVYCFGNFLDVNPLFAIIRQERFDDDITAFQVKLGIASPELLPKDPLESHMNDYGDSPGLSDRAIGNLARWYTQDFVFYRMCDDWIESGVNR